MAQHIELYIFKSLMTVEFLESLHERPKNERDRQEQRATELSEARTGASVEIVRDVNQEGERRLQRSDQNSSEHGISRVHHRPSKLWCGAPVSRSGANPPLAM